MKASWPRRQVRRKPLRSFVCQCTWAEIVIERSKRSHRFTQIDTDKNFCCGEGAMYCSLLLVIHTAALARCRVGAKWGWKPFKRFPRCSGQSDSAALKRRRE